MSTCQNNINPPQARNNNQSGIQKRRLNILDIRPRFKSKKQIIEHYSKKGIQNLLII